MTFITAREWYAKRGIEPKEAWPGGPMVLIDPAMPWNTIWFADLDRILINDHGVLFLDGEKSL